MAGCFSEPHEVVALPETVFPIGGYSGNPERDKAAGFTFVGPVYGKQKEVILEQAEKAGLPSMHTVGIDIDFLGQHGAEVREIDHDAIRAKIRQQVEAVLDSPSVAVWYLIPEELRSWRPLEMEYLKIASETIRETDPQKRPVWMYEPNHRTQGPLETTSQHLQLLGKGLYVTHVGREKERAWVTWSFNQLKKAAAVTSPDAVLYAVPEMFREPEDPSQIPAYVRHDCYASLLAGAKGIVIFSLARRANFPSHEAYYEAYSQVARELNGALSIGSIFLLGKERPLPAFEQVSGPTTVRLSEKSTPAEEMEVPALEAKAYSLNGRNFFFLVNSSPQTITLKTPRLKKWSPLFENQKQQDKLITLPPWGVSAFEIPPL